MKIVKKAWHHFKKIAAHIEKKFLSVFGFKHGIKHALKNIALAIVGIGIIGASILLVWIGTLRMPDFKAFDERQVINSTKIYDRTGKILLYDVHSDIKRTSIPYADMGVYIKNATVAIEDTEFWNHQGIRPLSIIRAVLANLASGSFSQGGSTLTQQIVKNTLLTTDKTITRKLKEWIISIKLERSLTKEQILELYLNESPYGGTVYGIEEASKLYFGKSAKDLTLAEAAYLAAIPKAPTFYSPFGKNKDRLEARKNLVLDRMKEVGFITTEEHTAAKQEQVTFRLNAKSHIIAPHFVFYIKDYLEKKYGIETVTSGGLSVITTIDATMQAKAETIVKDQALKNEKDFNGKNAALVAIDPKTGQILAMVGSRDYFDTTVDGNFNVATALRQPGSAFKPFIYETAFSMGYQPETVVFDLPTEFSSACNAYGSPLPGHKKTDCYMPDNFDNAYKGPISLRSALAESRNIPAVKMLYLVGINNALKTARDAGITSLEGAARYGLTLVIGGAEVSLLDMTSGYSVFANSGVRNPATGILEIKNQKGDIVEAFTSHASQVFDKNAVLMLSDVMSDNTARIPTFGANSALNFPGYQVAAKTGTTNDNKDAWTMAYTPNIAVGVWAGNNDNVPMKKGGSALAGPILHRFLADVLPTLPKEPFEKYIPAPVDYTVPPVVRGLWQGGTSVVIDTISGKRATEFTPPETRSEKVITNVKSILYWVNKTAPRTPKTPSDDDNQFSRWNIPIQNWWASHSGNYPYITEANLPAGYDDVHTPATQPHLTITTFPLETVSMNGQMSVTTTSQGTYPLKKVMIFIDDIYITTLENMSFTTSISPQNYSLSVGSHTLRVTGYDTVYNKAVIEKNIMVTE